VTETVEVFRDSYTKLIMGTRTVSVVPLEQAVNPAFSLRTATRRFITSLIAVLMDLMLPNDDGHKSLVRLRYFSR